MLAQVENKKVRISWPERRLVNLRGYAKAKGIPVRDSNSTTQYFWLWCNDHGYQLTSAAQEDTVLNCPRCNKMISVA